MLSIGDFKKFFFSTFYHLMLLFGNSTMDNLPKTTDFLNFRLSV
jgi:hypothetical protein